MKLVFFGTGAFAVPALQALAPHVILVVSQPDRPSGRGLKLSPSPMKAAAIELGIAVETPEKSRAPEFVDFIRSLDADALVVASYGQILSQKLLDSAKYGGINMHGSILPYYRGAAPIQRSILARDPETGVALMQMDKGMDTGDLIIQGRLEIGQDETYGELQDRLAIQAAELVVEWMPRIVTGDYPRTPQDHEAATHAPKIEKAEAELSCERDGRDEYARFRAFTPSPGAYLKSPQGVIRLGAMRFSEESGPSGTILATNPHLRVAFGSGSLDFVEIQPEGKKRMSGRDFANGARLKSGMRWIE